METWLTVTPSYFLLGKPLVVLPSSFDDLILDKLAKIQFVVDGNKGNVFKNNSFYDFKNNI